MLCCERMAGRRRVTLAHAGLREIRRKRRTARLISLSSSPMDGCGIRTKFVGSSFCAILWITLADIGNADIPAAPTIGLNLFPSLRNRLVSGPWSLASADCWLRIEEPRVLGVSVPQFPNSAVAFPCRLPWRPLPGTLSATLRGAQSTGLMEHTGSPRWSRSMRW